MDNTVEDPKIHKLRLNKEVAYKYRERREDDWKENYTLYRDRVIVNRLTQRQSVNMPLMKQTIRTLLKDVDDMPVLYFENLDNDKQKEVFQNEYWKWTISPECNRMELKDIVDKRQVFTFGRSFDQMQIIDGKIKMTIEDPEDILIDRYVDPTDIDSARFLIHTHIFKPLSYLLDNPMYDQDKVKKLIEWHKTQEGIIKSATNKESLEKKHEKMSDMGLDDVNDPILGEAYIELSMHFHYDKQEEDQEEQLYLTIEADDMYVLFDKPLEKVIGTTKDNYWRNHFPYNTWADDVDRQDFWTDGVADIVRPANKVLNAWFSQLVENRSLKNLNMNIFNSSMAEGFAPQTWQPQAWGMYGIPVPEGQRIQDVFQPLPVADLSESLDEMQYVVSMVEKATGATATQQGNQTEKRVTLGEVQLALSEAKQRVKGMSKFYTPAWQDRAKKFLKLIEAAPEKLDAVKVYKKGKNTNNIFEQEISPSDWMSESGYQVKIWSQDEKDAQDTKGLEKLNAVKVNMPLNPKVDEIYKRKLVEWADFTPDEVNEVMAYEEEQRQLQMAQMNPAMQGQQQQQMTPQPMAPEPQPQAPIQSNPEALNKLKSIRNKIK